VHVVGSIRAPTSTPSQPSVRHSPFRSTPRCCSVSTNLRCGHTQATLLEAVNRLAAFTGADVVVEGHTDNIGSADYNMKLSEARAEAVRAFLVSQSALKGRTINARGVGSAKPVATNTNEEGRQRNRRVELVISPKP
jgi:outer membrane protein OmpA-like peptidoglycan-associated protein